MPELPPDLVDAWEACLDGTIDDAAAAMLLAWIDQHPEALPALRREASMHTALGYLLAPPEAANPLREAVMMRVVERPPAAARGSERFEAKVMRRLPRRSRTRRRSTSLWLPLAACLAVGVAGAFMAQRNGWIPADRAVIAKPEPTHGSRPATETRVATSDAQVTASGTGVAVDGRAVAPGSAVDLVAGAAITADDAGTAAVRLRDGSVLTVSRGARLTLAGADATHRLDRGDLDVEAAPQAAGHALVISTPRATARVVGTAFRVEADAAQTWVQVRHGRVAVGAGGRETTVDPGKEIIADAAGLGEVIDASRRAVFDIRLAQVDTTFDHPTLGGESGTFHGLNVRTVDYPASAHTQAGFSDVGWAATLPKDVRRVEVWVRPSSITPEAGLDVASVAIMASFNDCDYVLGQRDIRPDERGWIRVEGSFAKMHLNWSRAAKTPAQQPPELARRLAVRFMHGRIDCEVTSLAVSP